MYMVWLCFKLLWSYHQFTVHVCDIFNLIIQACCIGTRVNCRITHIKTTQCQKINPVVYGQNTHLKLQPNTGPDSPCAFLTIDMFPSKHSAEQFLLVCITFKCFIFPVVFLIFCITIDSSMVLITLAMERRKHFLKCEYENAHKIYCK